MEPPTRHLSKGVASRGRASRGAHYQHVCNASVLASKGAGSAETLSRHHSVLVHVAATRGILRSCSRGGLHSGPVCNSHTSPDQVPTAFRVPACACRYACGLVNCRTSVEIALHNQRLSPHDQQDPSCDLELTRRTLTERTLAKPLVAECPRPSARASRRRTGPQAASHEGGVGGNEQYAVCAPGCHDATQSPGRACVQNQQPFECARAARAPTSPPTSPDSQAYVRCPKPSAKNGSRINCFHQERVHEGGKKLR